MDTVPHGFGFDKAVVVEEVEGGSVAVVDADEALELHELDQFAVVGGVLAVQALLDQGTVGNVSFVVTFKEDFYF